MHLQTFTPVVVPFIGHNLSAFNANATKELKELLSKAAVTCNRISKARHDICLGAETGGVLTPRDLARLGVGMEAISTAILRVRTSARPVDFEIEALCDCEITVDHLAEAGVKTLADIFVVDPDIYRGALLEAESNGAARQYHMLALTRSLH